MPQKQERRSEMWWRGHNDALAGDPPNESYYHYYYDYKVAYNHTRREQRRTHRQQMAASLTRSTGGVLLILLILGALIGGGWYWLNGRDGDDVTAATSEAPTTTPRPTPRPTLTPSAPTPTPEPMLRADGFAVVTGTGGAALNARSSPGRDGEIVARLREGQNVRILEGPESADDFEWWRVEADGANGWAAAPYLAPVDPPAEEPPGD
jgi:hypothetical protein